MCPRYKLRYRRLDLKTCHYRRVTLWWQFRYKKCCTSSKTLEIRALDLLYLSFYLWKPGESVKTSIDNAVTLWCAKCIQRCCVSCKNIDGLSNWYWHFPPTLFKLVLHKSAARHFFLWSCFNSIRRYPWIKSHKYSKFLKESASGESFCLKWVHVKIQRIFLQDFKNYSVLRLEKSVINQPLLGEETTPVLILSTTKIGLDFRLFP